MTDGNGERKPVGRLTILFYDDGAVEINSENTGPGQLMMASKMLDIQAEHDYVMILRESLAAQSAKKPTLFTADRLPKGARHS